VRYQQEQGTLLRPLWSHAETARYLGVPEATLHQWLYKGTGPRSYKVGRHRKYRPDEVEAWLEAHADQPPPAA
jgi:excisionase family DNA binding protein